MGWVRGFSKIGKGLIWKSKVLQTLLPRRRTTTPNKKSSRKKIREQAHEQVIPLWPFGDIGKEIPRLSKEKKESTHHVFVVDYIMVDFTNYGG